MSYSAYDLNHPPLEAHSAHRWVTRLVLGGTGVVIGVLLCLAGLWGYVRVQVDNQMRADLAQVVQVLNYNLQAGVIKLPPPPSAPSAPPPPAPSK